MKRLELIDHLQQQLAAAPCKSSLLMMDLTRGVELINLNADQPCIAAQTITLPILMTALDQAARSKLSMDCMVPIGPLPAHSTVFEAENYRPEYTLLELLEWMIVTGDTTAANAVIDLLGMDTVNDFVTRIGGTQTRLQRRLGDTWQSTWEEDNLTCARDQFMFCSLLAWCAKRDALWQEGMEMLYRQRSGAFLRYLCGPLSLAHVPGRQSGILHDSGLFMNDENPFYLGLFTWDGPTHDSGAAQQRLVARLGKTAYLWRMGML